MKIRPIKETLKELISALTATDLEFQVNAANVEVLYNQELYVFDENNWVNAYEQIKFIASDDFKAELKDYLQEQAKEYFKDAECDNNELYPGGSIGDEFEYKGYEYYLSDMDYVVSGSCKKIYYRDTPDEENRRGIVTINDLETVYTFEGNFEIQTGLDELEFNFED